MRATRSTRKTPVTATKTEQAETPIANNTLTLAPSSINPPMLFVLPEGLSADARIVTLPNPANTIPGRYYFCPEKGIYEFTKIAAPKHVPRSWLLAPAQTEEDINGPSKTPSESQPDSDTSVATNVSKGYAIQDADLFLATPLDPLFVLLPALIPSAEETKQLFLSIDDHLDALAETSKHLSQLIRGDKLRRDFERRAAAVCNHVDMGDEKMYRLSNEKLLAELLQKAKQMTANGLPPSMEEHFVKDALKLPALAVEREESSNNSQDVPTPASESQTSATVPSPSLITQDSAISVLTDATSFSTTSVIATKPSPPLGSDQVTNLLRLRTAFSLLLSSYIPPKFRPTLLKILSSPGCPVDFTPLDARLKEIADMKAKQHALRSVSDNISRKRSAFNDEEADEARADKKRKKEEDEAKKKAVSRSIKQLAKVDTSGMKKMSSFFTKAPAKKA